MRGKLILIIISLLLLTGCKTGDKKEVSDNETINKQKQIESITDYKTTEEKYLNDFKSFLPNSNVLCTKIVDLENDKNLDFIILFEDKKTRKKSNIAFVGKRGIYAIDIAADKDNLVFKEPFQITVIEVKGMIQGIEVPMINQKTNEQYNYNISLIASGNDQTFKIKSEKYQEKNN